MIADTQPRTILNRMRGFFRIAGFDAATPDHNRRDPGRTVRSTDDLLTETGRRQVISGARDLNRNFAVAAWAVRKHLDYVSSFGFQARTGNDDLNRTVEAFIKSWGKPSRLDVAGRHSLRRFIRLAEMRRTLDGDFFIVKQRDGTIQGIEGDRVRTADDFRQRVQGAQYKHGIRLGRGGRLAAVAVHRRSDRGGYDFEREIRAGNVLQLAYWDAFDQIRGVSPMVAAINEFQDVHEVRGYARAKAKVSQLFALAITREGSDSEEVTADYKVDFGKGPIKLDLDPGDKAEFLESKQPSTEFQAFLQSCLMAALKSLDIPWSFFDESFTNYSGSRSALIHYKTACQSKRDDLVEILDRLTAWRLGLAIAKGELRLPAGMPFDQLKWEWVHTGVPWFNPLQDIQASALAVAEGFTTRTQVVKETFGREWTEVIDQLEREQDYAKSHNVTINEPQGPAQS